MKRSLILTLLLFALSAAALVGSHSVINGRKDAVAIEETVLYGDRTAAEGITVLNRTHNDYHLFWDTSYTVENELKVHTDFLFSQEEKREDYNPGPNLSVSYFFNFSMGGSNIILEDDYEQGVRKLPMKPARDVAGRTQAGETHEETVYLKDYYDFYPFCLEINFPSSVVTTSYHNLYDMTDYLKVPVSETQRVRVSVTKDSTGNVTQVRNELVSEEIFFTASGVFTDSGCYFVINARENGTARLPEEVLGIRYIPFIKAEGFLRPSFEDIRMAYPLDRETAQVLYLLKSPDERRLMLFAEENGSITLSVIGVETMNLLQKTVLFEDTEDLFLQEIQQYDNFFAAPLSDGRFCLLQENAGGICEVKLTGNLYACEEIGKDPFYAFYNDMAMDYDGQRLAVAFYQQRSGCGTYLMVYNKDGLAYAGKYDHSTDRFLEANGHSPLIDPLSVNCG